MTIILPFAGFVLGAACQLASQALVNLLASSRNRTVKPSVREQWITRLIMGCFGAVIGFIGASIPTAVFLFAILIVASAATVIDAHERIIPNELVLAIIVLKLVFGVPTLLGFSGFPAFNVLESAIACVACLALFMLPRFAGGNIGLGDVKFAAAMGFCLGLNSLFAVMLMGAFVIAYGVFQRSTPVLDYFKQLIPMGPFLATAMMVVLLVDLSPATLFV